MADELVNDYWLNYKIETDTVRTWIRTSASGWQLVDELPAEKAIFLSDMLRNEKPVFYIRGKSLHTREEPPGEEES